MKVKWLVESESHQSCPTLFTPWTVAHQVPLSMGFNRQEYRSGLPCPPPGNLPSPGVKPVSLLSKLHWQAGSLPPAPGGRWRGRVHIVFMKARDLSPGAVLPKYFEKWVFPTEVRSYPRREMKTERALAFFCYTMDVVFVIPIESSGQPSDVHISTWILQINKLKPWRGCLNC